MSDHLTPNPESPTTSFDGLPDLNKTIILVFGYGSIMWKQNFEHVAEYNCYIKGYTRVFYQGTTDHRGVPGKPGRVVTLLHDEDPEARVYGKAYQLPSDPDTVMAILNRLDIREQGGYERVLVTLYNSHPCDKAGHVEEELDIRQHPNFPSHSGVTTHKEVCCLCYIATPGNAEYLGEAPMDEMAQQIVSCAGPSGTNREYLFHLAAVLREMGVLDLHVFDLDARVRELLDGKESEKHSLRS